MKITSLIEATMTNRDMEEVIEVEEAVMMGCQVGSILQQHYNNKIKII